MVRMTNKSSRSCNNNSGILTSSSITAHNVCPNCRLTMTMGAEVLGTDSLDRKMCPNEIFEGIPSCTSRSSSRMASESERTLPGTRGMTASSSFKSSCVTSPHQNHQNSVCRCNHNLTQIHQSHSQSSKFNEFDSLPLRIQSQLEHIFNVSGWKNCSVALVTITVILLLFPTSTMSSPLPGSSGSGDHHRHHKDRNRLHDRPAKWINPCRIPSSIPMTSDSEADMQTVADKDIFHHIKTQAAKAEKQASGFIKDFYKEAFGDDSEKFGDLYYDWLSDIMSVVNQDLNKESLQDLPVEETIKKVYMGLQKFAVGLEAIVLDQACYGGSYYQHFNEAEYQLKYVLCELQIAMLEKNIAYEDITRDIMTQEFRDLPDRATRNLRDWTIFRDYVKTLKYVEKAFHLYYNQAARMDALETNGAELRS